MGAIEEGGKVAGSVVEGLKSQPISLALIVMNVVFVAFVAWLLYLLNERTINQYKVKDEQTATLLQKLDIVTEVKGEVGKISERSATNAIIADKINATVERIMKTLEDHEGRIRELERRK